MGKGEVEEEVSGKNKYREREKEEGRRRVK